MVSFHGRTSRTLYSLRLNREKAENDGHALVEHEALIQELRKVSREDQKTERLRAIQALRYATRRKQGLISWSFDRSGVARKLVEEIDVQPLFDPRALIRSSQTSESEAAADAAWDVFFVRLSALQEYGWHAGLEALMWASDSLNDGISELDWPRLQNELSGQRESWIKLIIDHAKRHHEFFPAPDPPLPDEYATDE
jgi:hypothetical protein